MPDTHLATISEAAAIGGTSHTGTKLVTKTELKYYNCGISEGTYSNKQCVQYLHIRRVYSWTVCDIDISLDGVQIDLSRGQTLNLLYYYDVDISDHISLSVSNAGFLVVGNITFDGTFTCSDGAVAEVPNTEFQVLYTGGRWYLKIPYVMTDYGEAYGLLSFHHEAHVTIEFIGQRFQS